MRTCTTSVPSGHSTATTSACLSAWNVGMHPSHPPAPLQRTMFAALQGDWVPDRHPLPACRYSQFGAVERRGARRSKLPPDPAHFRSAGLATRAHAVTIAATSTTRLCSSLSRRRS
jgi:hypothetical protein